jgi:hypothetical protein
MLSEPNSHHSAQVLRTVYRVVFLDYPNDHRGYWCIDLASRHVITSRHVVFDESVFPF